MEFELVEEYILHGDRRFRLRVKGTNIIVNVTGESLDEALSKAARMLERMKFERLASGTAGEA